MELINKIHNYIQHPIIFKRVVLNAIAPLIRDDAKFIKMKWQLSGIKYKLDLENPKTFSAKIQWLKLHDRKPIYTKMVDKVEAKEYVASIIGEEYIIPTLAVWNSVDEFDWNILPNQFVMKCSHDSGGLVVCKDKNKLDKERAKAFIDKYLKRRYYWQNREWPYKNVKPRILIEKYMVDESGFELKDYKFFCFNGDVKYCQVIAGRQSKMTIDFYDTEWRHQVFHEPAVYPHSEVYQTEPLNYKKMIQISKLLCYNIPFVRIDLYNINGYIYFGEITFFPTSGMGGFSPSEWDFKFGELIQLPLMTQR